MGNTKTNYMIVTPIGQQLHSLSSPGKFPRHLEPVGLYQSDRASVVPWKGGKVLISLVSQTPIYMNNHVYKPM